MMHTNIYRERERRVCVLRADAISHQGIRPLGSLFSNESTAGTLRVYNVQIRRAFRPMCPRCATARPFFAAARNPIKGPSDAAFGAHLTTGKANT